MHVMSDLTPHLGDLVNQWFRSESSWWKKLSLILGTTVLTYDFSCMCLYDCCDIFLQCSLWCTKWATLMLVKCLVECSGHMMKGRLVWAFKSQLWEAKYWRRSTRRYDCQLTLGLEPDNWEVPTPPLALECMFCWSAPFLEAIPKYSLEIEM